MQQLNIFIRKNLVMVIALLAALVTSFFVPFDAKYIEYMDFKTLTCLFCVLAVVCALKNINFFYMLAQKTVRVFKNSRLCILALVYITFIGSMLITNDMALLAFLPLGYFILDSTGMKKHMAFTFIMQSIAANLGGMLTPFGNPQNLYLYTKFNIPNIEFIKIMAPPFVVSVLLITACCMFIKPEPMNICDEKIDLNPKKTVVYLILFVLSVFIVIRVIPYWAGLIVITGVLLFEDKSALRAVDYPLLMTFVFFFIFAGNMSRISVVRDSFSFLLDKSTVLFTVAASQFISNVPSAILLSQFTDNYRDLLIGVNIGGVGTMIASLASLIAFNEYTRHNPKKAASYIGKFSLYNFGFLIVLIAFEFIMRAV